MTRNFCLALCTVGLFSGLTPSNAQITVYPNNPSGDFLSGANPTTPIGSSGWVYTNVRTDGAIGINGTIPRSGNGSVAMSTSSSTGKADVEYQGILGTLGNLNSLSYDYYRKGSSTTTNWLAPSLRIYVDADGNMESTNDQGYLIFEPVYNNGNSAVVTDAWVSTDVFNYSGAGQSANVWLRQFGVGTDAVYNRTLQGWIAGQSDAGFMTLSGDSLIYGLSSGVGSGWAGTFDGAVDNINIGFGGLVPAALGTTFNFELRPTAVPEPGSIAMFAGMSLASGLVAVRRLRRK
ncbi:MAG: hypothetical protein H7308_01610 [Chthonomonadaceae bacterium]|nr:hypothetical protein [Chthonomonadaceae bacterium]